MHEGTFKYRYFMQVLNCLKHSGLLLAAASVERVKEKGSDVGCEYLMPQYPFSILKDEKSRNCQGFRVINYDLRIGIIDLYGYIMSFTAVAILILYLSRYLLRVKRYDCCLVFIRLVEYWCSEKFVWGSSPDMLNG